VLLAVYAAYNNVIVLFIALGAYAALVIQSLSSKKFHEKVQHREKTIKIEALNDS